MREIWSRIKSAAAKTPLPLRLRPGASESAIRAAERTIGISFPDDFRESLLLHDGQDPDPDDDCAIFDWLPTHPPLARLDAIVEQWKIDCETFKVQHAGQPPEEIENGWLVHYLWHPKRIPIAGNPWWDQDNTYLDFIPGSLGRPGQVVMFGKGVFGALHGPSFGEALSLYAKALESGEWLYRDGAIVGRAQRTTSWSRFMTKKLGLKRR